MAGPSTDKPRTLAELGVSAAVVAELESQGIVEAFPIQIAAIEAALEGRDICGKAPTGSGKTLAFGLPVIDRCGAGRNWQPSALILAPTRELATQIKEELEPLAKSSGRTVMTAFGGTNIERDIRRLETGVDILVACPGRLEDLIARRCCELRSVKIVVVDEADRMADMGFLPSVKRLLDQIPAERQTMLFSATLDGDVDTLVRRYQTDPLTFEVDDPIGEMGDVTHSWFLVQPDDRINSAVSVLRAFPSSIVFCRTRRGCDRVARTFVERGLRAVAIHGDRSQVARERALADFIDGRAHVLVATDVAARGIHVDDVALVMHYDPAATDKDYVHRSGRTGRAGQPGRVISMVVEDKKKEARQLQKQLGHRLGFDQLDLADFPPAQLRPRREPAMATDRPGRTDRSSARGPADGEPDHPERARTPSGRGGSKPGRAGAAPSSRRRSSKDWYPPSAEGRSSRARTAAGPNAKSGKPATRAGGSGTKAVKPTGNARGPAPKTARAKPKRSASTKDIGKRRSPRGQ